MINSIYTWHIPAWKMLVQQRSQLPHALLISGCPGMGKSYLVDLFAMGLLCERHPTDGLPCRQCSSCGWFSQANHPDFRRLQPESQVIDPEEDAGAKKEKKKSDQIKIDQIRDTESFLAVGTHRGGARIVLIDPADAMNAMAQSALLKNLEEPPPATLYLLVTHRPQRLLPTIRSRCVVVPFPKPDQELAIQWLSAKGVAHPAEMLALSSGGPLAALSAGEVEQERREFLNRLSSSQTDLLELAQASESMDNLRFVEWLQYWVADLLAARLAGQVRYHLSAQAAMIKMGQRMDPIDLLRYLRRLGQARGLAQHPLNARLFKEDLLLQYRTATRREAV